MAVSLAEYSRAANSRPRSWAAPPTMQQPYNPSEFIAMAPSQQFATHLAPPPSRPHRHSYTSSTDQWRPPQSQLQQEIQQSPYKLLYSPIFYPSPMEPSIDAQLRPPVPPKHPLAETTRPSVNASHSHQSENASQPSQHIRIEPDPLPPHTNPQALTKTQSAAFADSQPVPAVHIGVDEVRSSSSGLPDFRINREALRAPKFLSSKPVVTVNKIATSSTAGTIRFHAVTTNRIDLTINGRETSLAHQGVIHNRWGFRPTSSTNPDDRWFWKKDRDTGGAILVDSKRHGNVLAKIKGNLLTFEHGRVASEMYDEIVVSAVAMAEAARRQKRKSDIVDIATAIGDFADSGSGGGGEGGGGGSSSGK